MNAIVEQINSGGYTFVEFAASMLIQASVLILLLFLADVALRRRVRAVFRYWMWLLVLVKLVLPTSLSGPFSIGYWFGDKLEYADVGRGAYEPRAAGPMMPALPYIDISNVPPAIYPPATSPGPAEVDVTPAQPIARLAVPPVQIEWQGVVFLLWLAIVTALVLLLVQRAIFVHGLVTQAREASRPMYDALEECRSDMKVRGTVGLKVSPNTASPAVCGLLRAVILVPQNLASALDTADLRIVLLHELAHVKRGDLWINLAQTVLQIVYFYNPLLWLANAVIRRAREQAVDEAVLVAMGEKARRYPQTLVSVAKLAFKRPALSLRLIGVVESKSALTARIKRILSRPIPKSAKLGILGLAVIVITAVIVLPMAKAQLYTDRARQLMVLAEQEARRLKHEYVGTEHILLALAGQKDGVGSKVLDKLGIQKETLEGELAKLVRPGPKPTTKGNLPQTPRVKKALDLAEQEAKALDHDYIGTEHILLGLMQETDGLAAQMLANLEASYEVVREEVLGFVKPGANASLPHSPVPGDVRVSAEELIVRIIESERRIRDIRLRMTCTIPALNQTFYEYDWGYEGGKEFYSGIDNTRDSRTNVYRKVKVTRTLDGEREWQFSSDPKSSRPNGGIIEPNPNFSFSGGIMTFNTLLGFDAKELSRLSLGEALAQAESLSVRDQTESIDGRACYVIEAINLEADPSGHRAYDVRAWIDCQRDYRPLKFEKYLSIPGKNRFKAVSRRVDNVKLKQIDGIWLPIEGERTTFSTNDIHPPEGMTSARFGTLPNEERLQFGVFKLTPMAPTCKLEIDIESIRLNKGIPPKTFTIDFPKGCEVYDEFAGTRYVVGEPSEKDAALSDAELIEQTKELSVGELIDILCDSRLGVNKKKWFAAIHRLVEIGAPAVPQLVVEIRKTEKAQTQSKLALTLRAIGDANAVPGLIDALERSGFSSDYGLGEPKTELERSYKTYQMDPEESLGLGRPVREITIALEKLTGHSEGHDHFDAYDSAGNRLGGYTITPEIRDREREHRQEVAEKWRIWWQANKDNIELPQKPPAPPVEPKPPEPKAHEGGILAGPEDAQLTLAVVPNIGGSARQPRLTKEQYQKYLDYLAEEGPFAGSVRGDSFQWSPIKGDAGSFKGLPLSTYKDRTYILLCARAQYVMMPEVEGRWIWGLEKVESVWDNNGRPAIDIQFDEKGAELLGNLTKANIENHLAIGVDGWVLSAPVIKTPIGKRALIMGDLTEQDVRGFVGSLRKGMPAVDQQVVEAMRRIAEAAKELSKGVLQNMGPRQIVENLFVVGPAGNAEKLAWFFRPDSPAAKGITVHDFAQMADAHKTEVLEVYADANDALAVTSNIKGKDGEQEGRLLLYLSKQTGTWLIYDGDAGDSEKAHESVHEFLIAHPDVQVEVETPDEKAGVVWGEEADGLQLGLSYDSQERPYYQGEIVSFEVHVRNNGDKPVDLAYVELFQWCPYVRDVRDTNDATSIVNVHLAGGDASAREEHISLGPGDRQSLGKVMLQIGPVPKGAQRAEYSADFEPGGYVVTQTGRFRGIVYDSWRGELKTGELPLAVLPAQTSIGPPRKEENEGSEAERNRLLKKEPAISEAGDAMTAISAIIEEIKKRSDEGWRAVGVLSKMGPEAEEAIACLIEAALDKDLRFGDGRQSTTAYRGSVLYSLSRMTWARDRVIPVLQKVAEDSEEEAGVRRQVILALRDVGKSAMPILQKLTEAEEHSVRDAAHGAIGQLLEKEEGPSKDDYYTPLIEKDPFDPSILQYLGNAKGIVNYGRPHPLTQKIKKLYRERLAKQPDPQLAWRLACIIQNGLKSTELMWAAPTDGSKGRWPREDPTENYATLAEVLQVGLEHAEAGSQLHRQFGTSLAKLRLLQGDWEGMNAMLQELGQEAIPTESRQWLPAPPVDWEEGLGSQWKRADESMRSGSCSLEFRIEKDGAGLKGVHFLVKRAPEPTNGITSGISVDTLFFEPYPVKGFSSFGYKAADRRMTRYAVSDESGVVRFEKLPHIPIKIEVLVPTSNFPEAVSNWDLWMEVEPGKYKIAKKYGAGAIDTQVPPAVAELKEGQTVHYPKLVVRSAFGLNVRDWAQVDKEDFSLTWQGLGPSVQVQDIEYELQMHLSAPCSPHYQATNAPVVRSAKQLTRNNQWPIGAQGVGNLRLEAGNIYMFEVSAIDKSGTVVARWPRTRVWVPWGYRRSDPPFTGNDTYANSPVHHGLWHRGSFDYGDGRKETLREKVARVQRDYPDAFEYEYACVGKAWLDWRDGKSDGARRQLEGLARELPKGSIVRGTAVWLIEQIDQGEEPPKRLNFVPDAVSSSGKVGSSNPVEIEILPPESAELVWGESVNGLRAAIEFEPEKQTYSIPEKIGVRFHIQNVSNKQIQFISTTWRQEQRVIVEDQDGKVHNVGSAWYLGETPIERYHLQPGQQVVIDSSALGVAADSKQAEQLKHPVGYRFRCEPGVYYARFGLHLPGVRSSLLPAEDADFEGTLETSKRKLVVAVDPNSGNRPR